MEKLLLEIPTIYREDDSIEFVNEFKNYNENIIGDDKLSEYTNNYGAWLIKLFNNCDETKNKVPTKTYFLVREHDNKIIGIVNIRLKLNDKLRETIGNISYSIRPTERKKGYSKICLYLILKQCKNDKMEELLISCNKKNIAFSKTITILEGIFIKEKKLNDNNYLDFYTINIDDSIEKYKNIYNI